MKILMTTMSMDIGGAETHVMELAKELHRQGHTVVIASNGGVYVPELEKCGIRHVTVPMNQRSVPLMLRSLRLLRQTIRREQPDIVHAHARIPAFLCGILQKGMKFPLITSAHGVFQVTPLLKRMTNWGDRTVAISEDIRDYLMENYQVPADRIHVTINGINTDRFCPNGEAGGLRKELGLGPGPVVMLVSRVDTPSSYSARCLIEITPKLLARFPDAEVVIVGGGDQETALRQQAEEVCRRCGRNAVHMTGARTDVERLLSLATVFVGVSRAALEAMSMARPVILAGNPDYEQGYQGIFTPEKLDSARASNFCCRNCGALSRQALTEDLLTLMGMEETQRQELGRFGRSVVLGQYSVRRMAQDYLDAYDELLHPKKEIHALISGYYGYDNLGDDAILKVIAEQTGRMNPPVRLTVLSRRPRETASRFGLRAIPRFSPWAVAQGLRRSDLLISGGGSLLQDRTSTRSLLYYLAVIRLAKRMKKPVFLYANGVGPLLRNRNRKRVARTLKDCDVITLRDSDSVQELTELGMPSEKLILTADPAFLLEENPEGRKLIAAAGVPEGRPVLGVSVRRAVGKTVDAAGFAALCDRLSREKGLAVVFVAMQNPGDLELSRQIRAQMQEEAWILPRTEEPELLLGAIGAMEAVISMRLHTIIFAAKMRVPVLGCEYDPKVGAFLSMLEQPSCGSPEALDTERAFRLAEELLAQRECRREALEKKVDCLRRKSRETEKLLVELTEQMGK